MADHVTPPRRWLFFYTSAPHCDVFFMWRFGSWAHVVPLTAEISPPDMNCVIAGTWNRRWISMWRAITHWSTSTMAWRVRTSCLSVGYETPTGSSKESRSSSYLTDRPALICQETELVMATELSVFIRYKKNIKAFYIVHPTMFIRTVLIFFKPLIRSAPNTLQPYCNRTRVICKDGKHMHTCFVCVVCVCLIHSFKFGQKVHYVNYLSELEEIVKCDQLVIPSRVRA